MAEEKKIVNTPVEEIVNEMGVIGKQTKVTGNIKTKGHITIEGSVTGDVSARGNVIVRGSVKGTITCNNLMVEAPSLEATEIIAQGTVVVKENSAVLCDVSCKDITVAGKVEGRIDAADRVGLAGTAEVIGDIKASQIAVDLGAKIKGALMFGLSRVYSAKADIFTER